MSRLDTQNAIGTLAAADGITLHDARHLWLSQRGHLALPAGPERAALEAIYLALGGDLAVLATACPTALPNDYYEPQSRTLVEVDEVQHFTSARLTALQLYPSESALGYDLTLYTDLYHLHSAQADRYFATKPARGFGPGGRQRQRAYYDALRDLGAVASGHPPTIRVAAPEGDAGTAYARVRPWLLTFTNGRNVA